MTVLNIGGQRVTVGDDFMSLTPDQQQATVDEIAAQLQSQATVAQPTQLDISPTGGAAIPTQGATAQQPVAVAAPAGGPGEGFVEGVGQAAQGFNEGLAQVLGLPVDLVNAAVGMVAPGLSSKTPFLGSNQLTQFGRQTGLIGPTPTTGGDQFVRRVGREIGASAVPAAGMLGAGIRAGSKAIPLLRQAATAPGRFAATETALGTSAGVGAATAQQVFPGSEVAELTGQLVGGVGPAVGTALARGVVRQGQAPALQQAIDDFAEVGASPSAAQGAINSTAPFLQSALANAPGGNVVFLRAMQRQQDRIGEHMQRLADGVAPGADPTRAGVAIRRGIEGFLGRFRDRSRRLYGRLNTQIPPDARVPVSNTTRIIEDVTGPIQGAEATSAMLANPRFGQVAEAFAADAADGTLPFQAVQNLRTRIGERLTNPQLVEDIPRGELKRLYGALSADMQAAAQEAGPDAVRAFNRANSFYQRNIQAIDDFLQPISDRNLPEQAFNMAVRGKEGATQIGSIRNSLTANQWRVVSSAVLRRLGRAQPSAQGASGDTFSTETFLTNWNKLDPSAKNALFRGVTPTLRRDLDRVANVAEDIRRAREVLFNPSGTSATLTNATAASVLLSSLVTGNLPVAGGIAASAGLSSLGSALLTNPRAVRWLARGTQIPASRLPGHIARLVTEAKDDPQLMEVAQQLVEMLNQASAQPNATLGQPPSGTTQPQ